MATEVSLRKRLDGLAESSRYDSAEFCAPPLAPIETPAPANAEVSSRVPALYAEEDDPPQLSQHTDLSGSQRSFGSSPKLITGVAIVLALGLSTLAYFFLASPREKAITQTTELAPGIPSPPATPPQAAPSAAPAAATPSATPAAAALPPPSMNSTRVPEPVKASPKVAQSRDVLYLQRPGVNIRSIPSPSGSALGTAPKGTRFKVTNRQADWIEVESGRLKGWINAQFLAPTEPR
jgi:uncharacterized protein YgiM (DUF1202 family)